MQQLDKMIADESSLPKNQLFLRCLRILSITAKKHNLVCPFETRNVEELFQKSAIVFPIRILEPNSATHVKLIKNLVRIIASVVKGEERFNSTLMNTGMSILELILAIS